MVGCVVTRRVAADCCSGAAREDGGEDGDVDGDEDGDGDGGEESLVILTAPDLKRGCLETGSHCSVEREEVSLLSKVERVGR